MCSSDLLAEANNIRAIQLDVRPSYTATVQTDVVQAPAGTVVQMTGSATQVDGGAPQAFSLVRIKVVTNGYSRNVDAVTDKNGNFKASFTPLPSEAGHYTIGAVFGESLLKRKIPFVKQEYIDQTHAFYEKHGGKTIIIARFMPIFRTFVPVVAGAAEMGYTRFALYNVVGGASWVSSMTLTGYLLANWAARNNFPIDKHIEKLIIIVVFLSILPALVAYARRRFGRQAG